MGKFQTVCRDSLLLYDSSAKRICVFEPCFLFPLRAIVTSLRCGKRICEHSQRPRKQNSLGTVYGKRQIFSRVANFRDNGSFEYLLFARRNKQVRCWSVVASSFLCVFYSFVVRCMVILIPSHLYLRFNRVHLVTPPSSKHRVRGSKSSRQNCFSCSDFGIPTEHQLSALSRFVTMTSVYILAAATLYFVLVTRRLQYERLIVHDGQRYTHSNNTCCRNKSANTSLCLH